MTESPSEIAPDVKDWTWVLDQPCPECGFVAAELDPPAAGERLREIADTFGVVLDRPDVARRARPDRWSDLEYACHVRDVLRIFDGRLARMLSEDDPLFANWDQDATAVEDAYALQDPAAVRAELLAAAEAIARRYEGIEGAAWDRTGRRSDGASFTVASLTRYLVHDPHHHLWDVGAL